MKFYRLLLVDAGNTRIKWAATDIPGHARVPATFKPEGEIPTASATAKSIATLKGQFPGCFLVFCSVVPKVVPLFRRFFKQGYCEVSSELPALGLTFDYPNPREIGADRLAAAAAVAEDRRGPAILVSCGTAVAFSVLDAKGRFCGGAIAPGLQTQLAALIRRTAQLPEVDLGSLASALAKTTSNAIRAGVLLSFQGGVKEIVHRLAATFPRDTTLRVILTGGDAELAAAALDVPHEVRPLLVLEGLRIIGNRHIKLAKE